RIARVVGLKPTYSARFLLFLYFPGAAGEGLVAAFGDEAPGAFRGAAVGELTGDRDVGLRVERELVARLHALAVEAQLFELRRVIALLRSNRHATCRLTVAATLDGEVEAAGAAALPRTAVRSYERSDVRLRCHRNRAEQRDRCSHQPLTHIH